MGIEALRVPVTLHLADESGVNRALVSMPSFFGSSTVGPWVSWTRLEAFACSSKRRRHAPEVLSSLLTALAAGAPLAALVTTGRTRPTRAPPAGEVFQSH